MAFPVGGAIVWGAGPDSQQRAKELLKWLTEEGDVELQEEQVGAVRYTRIKSADDPSTYFAALPDRWIVAFGPEAARLMAREGSKGFADSAIHGRVHKAWGELQPFLYWCVDVVAIRDLVFKELERDAGKSGKAGKARPAEPAQATQPARALNDAELRQLQALGYLSTTQPSNSTTQPGDVPSDFGDPYVGAIAGGSMTLALLLVLLGGASIGSGEFAGAVEFNGPHLQAVTYAKSDDAHPILIDFFAHKPMDLKRLAEIPADAISFNVATFDAQAMYTRTVDAVQWYWREAARRLPAGQITPPPDIAQSIRDQLGFDPKDKLALLGDHSLTYTRPGLLSIAIVIDVRDAEGLRKEIDRLLALAGDKLKFTDRQVIREKLHVLDFSAMGGGPMPVPFSPCWALTKDRLVISPDVNAARQYLRHIQGGGDEVEYKSAQEFPAVKEFLAQHQAESLSAIGFVDEEQAFMTIYGQLALFYPMVTNMATNAAPDIKFGPLPPLSAFTKHMSPTVSWTTVEAGVRVSHSRTGVPSITGSVSPAAAGMGVAILMPSLMRAREIAKRAQCASNLRQLGIAMHTYASDHDDRFPSAFQSLVDDNRTHPKMFVCPSSDVEPGELDACYIYIGGEPASSDPSNVLVYERDWHDGEGGNVLFVDGHVEFVKPYSTVEELVQATKTRIAERAADQPKK